MKTILTTFVFILLAIVNAISQPLTGTKSIPGDYASIKLAIDDLNLNGSGPGGVIFNISSDYKEIFTNPDAGRITTTTGSSSSPITFRKNGSGANPLITAGQGTGNMDAIFAVAGSDYVTFDGLSIQENPDNFEDITFTEWGFAILKASGSNGSQHITIKNCNVTLSVLNPNSVGIYSNNHTVSSTGQLVVTSADGSNSNLKIYGNTLTDCYHGIYLKGYADAAPYLFYDQNNEIGKDGANTITNIGGMNVVPYGIYAGGQNNLKVANNTITSAMNGSTTVYGICLTSSTNASYDLYGNTVSLQFNADNGASENLYPIYCDMGASGTSNVVNVFNNTVSGCTYPSQTYAVFYGMFIYNCGVTTTIYGNSVINNSLGSDWAIDNGQFRYLWIQQITSTPGTLEVHDNLVSGNSRTSVGSSLGPTYMLTITGGGTTLNAYNNTISDNVITSGHATNCLYISYADQAGKYIHNNRVANMTEANGSTAGIYNANGAYGYFYNNTVTGIHASPSASNAMISGINHASGAHIYYYNNMISDLTNPGSTALLGYDYNMLNGIYVEGSVGTFKGFYNNTVYLNSTATNTSEFGSSAFCTQRLSEIELKNNIFINVSASAGANGKTVGIRSRETGLGSFSSNYNDIYCGTPGPANLIFYDGTNAKTTLGEYQSFATPNDLQSITSLPPFVNVATAPFDLHIKTTIPTQCESAGSVISAPLAISTDFDGTPRYPNPGYPVNGAYLPTAPDLGADEFGGLPVDLSPPAIVYTPLGDINNGNARTLSTTITDPAGVPVSGFGLPVLYWKKNTDPYAPVTAVYAGNGIYNFTFGGGAALNDVISYYIVAQDNVTPFPNVGAFPVQGASGFSANPPTCTTPPGNPSTYKVVLDISGIKHIGIGKDYNTITAAAADLNLKYMAGPVTFILDDNTYPNETFPIYFNERPGNSATSTLTIKPNAGANPVIIGSSFMNGIIIMNGIDYVTIDGSNNGTGSKNLTIENTSSSGDAHAFGITNHGGKDPSTYITLKNCILKGNKVNITVENCVIAFNFNSGATGGGYNNCVITNNSILKSKYGIRLLGSPGNMNRDIVISHNILSSADTGNYLMRGAIEVTESSNTMISDNEIMGWANGTGELFEFGIIVYGDCPGTKIYRNKIHDIYSLGWGAYGIKYSNESSTPTSEIFNNVIYDIKCWGANPGMSNNNPCGIFVRRGSNAKIWHNTISLTGPYLNGSDSYMPSSSCIGLYESATIGLDIRDNILRNSMTNPANPGPGSGAEGRAYGIQFAGGTDDFANLDYNDYFIDGYHATIAGRWITGYGFGDFYNTLADWQAYTGMDVHSDTLNPAFTSDTIPVNLVPKNLGLNATGGPKILDTDYNSAQRFSPPDIGAYEWSGTITDYHTLPATSVTATGAVLNGDINTKGEYVEIHFDYGTTANYGNTATPNPSVVRSVGALLPFNVPITGLLPNTTYHFRFYGIPTTSIQSIVYGADLTFTTPSDIPVNTTVQNDTVHTGQTRCYNALQTITIAGSGSTFVVENGGSATMIAGQKITYLPGTKVNPGGYLHGYITLTSEFCNFTASPMVAADAGTLEAPSAGKPMFRIYPNPTTGIFTLETPEQLRNQQVSYEIFGIRGEKILTAVHPSLEKEIISLEGRVPGIYFIRVASGGNVETMKIVKQ